MSDATSLAAVATALGPTIIAFDVGRYFVAASLMFLIVLLVRLTPWRRRRIQPRGARAADYRREIFASVRTGLIFAFVGVGVAWGAANGVMQVIDGPPLHWALLLATLALMLVVHDAYFYWTHRAMHHPRLFRTFHRHHHKTVTPTPFAAYSFAAPEALVQAMFMPLWLLAVPTHPIVIGVFLLIMIVRNVWGHAGHELHPRGMADHPLWGQISTTVHHDLHHAGSFNHNFGFYFTWWDRWMGTEHLDYAQVYREVTAVPDKPKRSRLGARAMPLGIATVVATFAAPSADAAETSLAGEWATQGYSARVLIGPCVGSPASLCGRIVWLWEEADALGRLVLDANNPNRALRARPLAGATILDGRWRDGRIYNPEDGRSYSATLTLRDANSLAVEGCALVFCRTQLWRRLAPGGAPLRDPPNILGTHVQMVTIATVSSSRKQVPNADCRLAVRG